MKRFFKKYALSSLFALGFVIQFVFILYCDFGIDSFWHVCIPIVLAVLGIFLNYKMYLKTKIGKIFVYIFKSIVVYIFSLIIFSYLESDIESMIHQIDSENLGGGLCLFLSFAEISLSFFAAYLLPLVLKIVVCFIRKLKEKVM